MSRSYVFPFDALPSDITDPKVKIDILREWIWQLEMRVRELETLNERR